MLPIHLRGARTHNLRDLDLDLSPGELVAIVGPSGAGKSSLAFATLYAEGQRRFVESFSAYARQFLERLERPDVDSIEPIAAAIAVDRQGEIRSSRSTVGSLTDVTDYAKSLWAHRASILCSKCGAEVTRHTAESATQRVLSVFQGRRILVCYAEVVADAEAFVGVRENLVHDGYRRLRVDGAVRDLDEVRPSDVLLERKGKGRARSEEPRKLEVVVERCTARDADRTRLTEALEVAFRRGLGRALVFDADGEKLELTTGLVCTACDLTFPDPSPGLFSFNSPVGACDACRGFGRVMAIDWEKALDPRLSLEGGALVAWKGKSTEWERGQLKRLPRR